MKTIGDVMDRLKSLETDQDIIKFFKEYWELVEEVINEEEKLKLGQTRLFGKVFDRVRSNLIMAIGDLNPMREQYIKKVLWFLYL
jgi:hypothetical protein